MIFAARSGLPYWLRDATDEELTTHLRLMTTLQYLETHLGHIETAIPGHPQAATYEEKANTDHLERLLEAEASQDDLLGT